MAARSRAALALAALALAAVALLARRCADPEVAFIRPDARAPWRSAPLPVSASLQQWGVREVPIARFTASLDADTARAAHALEVRALRSFRVQWRGEWLSREWSDPQRWREWRRFEFVRSAGAAAPDELVIEVRNAQGPALVQVRIAAEDGAGGAGASMPSAGPEFDVALDGAPLGPSAHADDTRPHAESLATETPLAALRALSLPIALLFAAGTLLPGFLRQVPALRSALASAGFPAALCAAAWLLLFAPRFAEIPLEIGFDARHHAAYVEYLLAEHRIPLATDGWSTFHPPLFYAMTALVVGLTRTVVAEAPVWSWRAIPFLSGLAHALAVFALARTLARSERMQRGEAVVALLFAALLPVHLYSSGYLSNEPLHAAFAGLASLLAVRALLAERTSERCAAGIGAVLGLAALAKLSALALVPITMAALALKLVAVERRSGREALIPLGALAATAIAICGWFYLRNWIELGNPIVTNWSFREPGLVWWQQPGFHTPDWYLSFGESLRHPYFSGFRSFWDGLYSSAFGDGFIAGRADPSDRHPFFRYDYMSACYVLALPVPLLVAAGIASALRDIVDTARAPRERVAELFLLAILGSVAYGYAALSLDAPFYSQVKASYGLLALAPVSIAFARGHALFAEKLRARLGGAADAALAGWLVAYAGSCALAIAGPL
jgi:hypothetical protein